MAKVNDIYELLCGLAPLELQMDFDNSGFLLGHGSAEVNKVLLTLDVTFEAAREAVAAGAELIISHHPLIFTAVKSVTDMSADGEKLLYLAENRVAVISMHTNLDIAQGGVNDVLIEALGAKAEGALDAEGCGRVGSLPEPVAFEDFLGRCKKVLGAGGLRCCGGGSVSRVAVMGGSGGDCVALARAMGCDTYVTGDVKHHQFLQARELGLNLIDAGHFCTENPVLEVLAQRLRESFPAVEFAISRENRQTPDFYI